MAGRERGQFQLGVILAKIWQNIGKLLGENHISVYIVVKVSYEILMYKHSGDIFGIDGASLTSPTSLTSPHIRSTLDDWFIYIFKSLSSTYDHRSRRIGQSLYSITTTFYYYRRCSEFKVPISI
jgi:hypothetical protein